MKKLVNKNIAKSTVSDPSPHKRYDHDDCQNQFYQQVAILCIRMKLHAFQIY